jgi:N utilization substance protein A
VDEEHKIANVIVPERQLSLAIGKEGQNARLAAKLTGWRIDIRSDAGVATAAAHHDGDEESGGEQSGDEQSGDEQSGDEARVAEEAPVDAEAKA